MDLSDVAHAAARGAIDVLLVDSDTLVSGTFDEATGRITLTDEPSKDDYGVIDADAIHALATGSRVMAMRQAHIPDGQHAAAILRYALQA
jgi:hypothetical protein